MTDGGVAETETGATATTIAKKLSEKILKATQTNAAKEGMKIVAVLPTKEGRSDDAHKIR